MNHKKRGQQQRLGARRIVLACSVVLACMAACTGQAFALMQRGVSFSFAFGSKGGASGELMRPAGIGINEGAGDVYVVDAGNQRIERFGPAGEFLAAWGWGVSDGKGEYEVCTSVCKAGLAGEGEGQLDAPQAVVVDNSTNGEDPSRGDLYVLADTAGANGVVEKFNASGEFLGRLALLPEVGALGGVAVDANGTVWVNDLGTGEFVSFNDAVKNVRLSGSVEHEVPCEVPGFAVDATGATFYVAHQFENLEQECPEAVPSTKAPAVAARLNSKGEALSEVLDYENTSGIAVDLASASGSPLGEAARGDVYLDNGTSIAVFDAAGSLLERFGNSEQLTKGAGIAINSKTGQVYVADASGNRVAVFAPEAAGRPSVDSASFEDISPTATRLLAAVDPHGAETHAYFQYGTADCATNPEACTDIPLPPGQDVGEGYDAVAQSMLVEGLSPGTTYFYRVLATNTQGKAEASQTLATFTTLPAASDLLADNRAWELVSVGEKQGALIYPIGGTTENGGPAEGVIQAAQDGSSITYAADGPIGEAVAGNRALEATQLISRRESDAWTTSDINTPSEHAEGLKASAASEYRFFSSDLSLGLAQPFGPYAATGTHIQAPPLVEHVSQEERGLYLRSDGSCQVTPGSCFQPLVSGEADTAGTQFGGELEFRGASADLRHVVFSSDVPLTSEAPSAPGLYEWNAERPPAQALELVSVLPGNRTAAPTEPEPALGDFISQISAAWNAISSDGARVFWSAVTEERENEITRLYMRDTTTNQTIVLNEAQGVKELPAAERRSEEVHFRTASTDGTRVFFTDNFPLTPESQLHPREEGSSDLYVCEISEAAQGPECHLKDLTVDPGSATGESADVLGTLPGASEDGSYVYFVANGVLSEEARSQGARPGSCARPNDSQAANPAASCNLYLEHYDTAHSRWETPRFIATLSQEDSPDWGSTGSESLAGLTSRVSPNGRYLAFMSSRPLTGYDNVDSSEAAQGARDEEVYLYDAASDRLTCASCNPSGTRPTGILDRQRGTEGQGQLVDRFGVWQEDASEEQGGQRRPLDHWLAASIPGWTPSDAFEAAYQSRYLSDEGRLFFDSADGLVPADRNGKEDVYEYEPQGIGTCTNASGCVSLMSSGESEHESAFLDASENGNDVFFLTSQPLVPSDHDTAFDVYDARVCTQTSPCLTPSATSSAPCETLQTCRPSSPSVNVFAGPSGSAAQGPPGNFPSSQTLPSKTSMKANPLTRAQKLARSLHNCRARYKHSRHKRAACERRTREQYTTTTSASHAKHRYKARTKKGHT